MRKLALHILTCYLFLSFVIGSTAAAPPVSDNPLEDYIYELDEMGRTLSGWKGNNGDMNSWFFGSYAMLILQNNGDSDLQPFPAMESMVPTLWSDFKYLSPRYLVELAGGTLSYGNLMQMTQERPFAATRTEEQFILLVAGMSYLHMLEGSVGEPVFKQIISQAMASVKDPVQIDKALCKSVSFYCGEETGKQFELALSSGSWMDVELRKVRKHGDSLEVFIHHKGDWSFPVDVLLISEEDDSTRLVYKINAKQSLKVPGFKYKMIILDPDHKLAEFYRYNNKWPRLKDNIYLQPFAALPDWENYRIKFNPSSWSDWDGDKRYGLKFTSGFGMDLWPAYPSDYRHRISWEVNSHSPLNAESSWGWRLSYGHPLSRKNRLFGNLKMHIYDDWRGVEASVTRYIGEQTFLVQGPRLKYQRVKASFELDSYEDSLVWQRDQSIGVLKTSYSRLSMTRYGDRLFTRLNAALGNSSIGTFSVLKSQVDLSGVFWSWLVTGVQFVAGGQTDTTPCPYQFTHTYAWQDNLAAIPYFRGQTKLSHRTNNYVGLSLDGGYWMTLFQMKMFASSMIADQLNVPLNKAKPHYAFGFGLEHKSFFTAGLYFPIWQSHPIEGETPWAWRYQWRLTWNL